MKKSINVREALSDDTKRDDIRRIVKESYQYFNRPLVKSDEELAERLNDYFTQCCTEGQIPTVEDMCLALGGYMRIINDWMREDSPRSSMLKKAKALIAASDAKLVSEGRIPQVTYIFRAKNFYGMKDQQDVVVTPANTERISASDIREKYLGEQMRTALPEKEIIDGEYKQSE